MFINIKYLVITVISIFLALGIGILIGIQVDSQDIILEQQEITVQKMENKFDELNRLNFDLQSQIKQLSMFHELNENYIKNIFPDYIKNKLQDLHIVIIETTDDYTYTNMREALKMAGGKVTSVTLISERLLFMSNEDKNELMEHFGVDENIIHVVLKNIVETVIDNNQVDDITFLIEKGIIYVNGDFANPADYVVIAGGSREKNDKQDIIDVPIIREVKKRSLPVIGVEVSDVANSYIELFKKEKLSTVDNVDTIIGQTSLILVISGKEGHFGVKKTANSLMPFLSEEEKSR
ncbi:MAG: copper transporter [Tepidanaerobacteraceae bacterium]|nr:copper transporter [Tepidanaerobacteraceae bacterium]